MQRRWGSYVLKGRNWELSFIALQSNERSEGSRTTPEQFIGQGGKLVQKIDVKGQKTLAEPDTAGLWVKYLKHLHA